MTYDNHIRAGSFLTLASFSLLNATTKYDFKFGAYALDFAMPHSFKSFQLAYIAICVFFFVFGSGLPDIDSEKSAIGRYFRVNVKHRSLHNFYILCLLFLISIVVRPFFWACWGYFLHMIMDSFSYAGVCWFKPVKGYKRYANGAFVKKNHKCKVYRNNSAGEGIFLCVVIVLCLAVTLICFKLGAYDDILIFKAR